jgi:hypothetical protein
MPNTGVEVHRNLSSATLLRPEMDDPHRQASPYKGLRASSTQRQCQQYTWSESKVQTHRRGRGNRGCHKRQALQYVCSQYLVCKRCTDGSCDCGIEVGVRKDNVRVLATELKLVYRKMEHGMYSHHTNAHNVPHHTPMSAGMPELKSADVEHNTVKHRRAQHRGRGATTHRELLTKRCCELGDLLPSHGPTREGD